MPDAEPTKVLSLGAIEQWDAHQAIGNLTAKKMMDRAIDVSKQHGVGIVALGAMPTTGCEAVVMDGKPPSKAIGICWTNALAVMPPWGRKNVVSGQTRLSLLPTTPITMVDMSCSMYSYGMLEVHRLAGRQTFVDAGFDDDNNPTRDPATVEKNRRLMPMGF